MTVAIEDIKAGPYEGDGAKTEFDFDFKTLTDTDVAVYHLDANDDETLLVKDTDYTITLNADQNGNPGGSITKLGAVLPAGEFLTLVNEPDFTQSVKIRTESFVKPSVMETMIDRVTILAQRAKLDTARSLKMPVSWDDTPVDLPFPKADNILMWNDALDGFKNVAVSTVTLLDQLRDADNDTKIWVEKTADDDTIRFDVAGTERGDWTAARLRVQDILEIHSADNTLSALHFGDPEDADVGRITYDHSGNVMRLYIAGTQKVRVDSTGLGIGNDSPSEALDVTGNIEASGNIKAVGYLDFNKQSPAAWYSGDIAGARWLTKLGGFSLSWMNTLATAGYESITGPDSETYYSTIRFHGTNGLQVYGNASFSTGTGRTIIGSTSGDASALLDMVSTTKGLGLPSMTTTQRDNISTPRDGLLVYNSTSNAVNGRINGSWESLDIGAMQLTRETAQASTSGTSIDFTSLPAGANRITVIFDQVSLSGTDEFIIQIGDSGGLETSGYLSASSTIAGAVASSGATTGFNIRNNSGNRVVSGTMVLVRVDGNDWDASHSMASNDGAVTFNGGGSKTLSAELDRVSIGTSGSNTFDAGQINVFVEV